MGQDREGKVKYKGMKDENLILASCASLKTGALNWMP